MAHSTRLLVVVAAAVLGGLPALELPVDLVGVRVPPLRIRYSKPGSRTIGIGSGDAGATAPTTIFASRGMKGDCAGTGGYVNSTDNTWSCSDGSTGHAVKTVTSARPIDATRRQTWHGNVLGWALSGFSPTEMGSTTGAGPRFATLECPAGSSFTGLLAPAITHVNYVQVTDGTTTRRPAGLGFLSHGASHQPIPLRRDWLAQH